MQQVPGVISALAPTIHHYGYVAVFCLVLLEDFGVPVPGETIMIAAAFYAGLGHLTLPPVIASAFAGAVIGDSIGFAIGQLGGRPLVLHLGKYVFLTAVRLGKLEAYFTKRGPAIVVIARFIEGLRQLNGIIAGLSEMRWRTFIIFNATGAIVWASFWSIVGYFGGSHIAQLLRFQLYLSAAFVLAIIVWFIWKHFKKHPSV